MVNCFLDSRLKIDIPLGKYNIPLEKWLEEEYGATLISDINKIAECCLSIVRLDDSSEPLRRCAILYHSISNKIIFIVGFLKDKKSAPLENHLCAMSKLISLEKEEELRKIIELAMELIQEGKDDDYIKETLKKAIEIKKSGLFENYYKSLLSAKKLTFS